VSGRVFLDTNILAYPDDASAGRKRKRAAEVVAALCAEARAVVSTQVLQEYFVTATQKLGMAAADARANVERFSQLEVVLVRPDLVLGAIDLHRLHSISFWDALIVRSASAGGCSLLLSEDLVHGQVIDGVRIENPFASGRASERGPGWKTARRKRAKPGRARR